MPETVVTERPIGVVDVEEVTKKNTKFRAQHFKVSLAEQVLDDWPAYDADKKYDTIVKRLRMDRKPPAPLRLIVGSVLVRDLADLIAKVDEHVAGR